MARNARRLGEQVSVDELLRETGKRARQPGDGTPLPARELPDEGEDHRERLERQARSAAEQEQRTGRNLQRMTALVAGVIVLITLVVLGVLAVSPDKSPASLAFGPLQPATTAPTPPVTAGTTVPATNAAPPMAVTMSASESSTAAPAPPPPPPAPTPACAVQFTMQSEWDGGFTAAVAITNLSDSPLSPWSLNWTFRARQQVTQGWNGTYSQNGSQVSVTPASWNGTIDPGATLSTGFNGSFSRSNPVPTSFTLNGTACSTS